MKKKLIASSIMVLLAVLFFGCKKNKDIAVSDVPAKEAFGSSESYNTNDLFNTDYSFEGSTGQEAAGLSESVIPGVRKLSEYVIQYATSRMTQTKVKSAVFSADGAGASDEKTAGKDKTADKKTEAKKQKKAKKAKNEAASDFYIEEWGPQNEIVAQSDRPSFYVIFSKPVKPLSALEKPSDKSDYMSVSPKLAGVFRWYGNQHLSFEATEAPDPSAIYTISVPSSVTSLEGDKISGRLTFQTQAAPIDILQLYPCYKGDSEYEYWEKRGALPPLDKVFFLRLNYAIPEARFDQIVRVHVQGSDKPLKVSAQGIYSSKYLFSWGSRKTLYSTEQKMTNTYVVTINEELPKNNVILIDASVGNTTATKSFYTVQPFSLSKVEKTAAYSGKHKFPLTVEFTQAPDIDTLAGRIETDLNVKITKDNLSVNGTRLQIYDLPLNYDETHTITFKSGIKDVFGQELSNPELTYTFKTLSPKSYVKYTDLGVNIMEAQFPHKYVFEYQNVDEGSQYRIYKFNQPWNSEYSSGLNSEAFKMLDSKTRNRRLFGEIDLNPYLNKDGFGTVRFDSDITYPEYNKWSEKMETIKSKRSAVIQVTDLGVTTRFGMDKAVVLVSSMKTGKPVTNATVYVGPYSDTATPESVVGNAYGHAKTNSQGLAVINISANEQQHYIQLADREYSKTRPMVYVEAGSDSVLYVPDSHYIRGYEINYRRPNAANKVMQQTFMFVDRGLYRPGETVTFRGIDRDLYRGKLKVHTGAYTLEARENVWRSTNIIATDGGVTTANGGFYGTFKIPDDAHPGNYLLEFKRSDSKEKYSVNFIIAEFERLKFESSVKIPSLTYYGGDSLSANITASYLAGGALAGASYNATWYKQPTSFVPRTPETKGYLFANGNSSESRDVISQASGILGADGKASVSCKSTKIVDGKPYSYRLSASITDLSNQQISASGSVIVHPALFYVGVARPAQMTGFAKKGDKLDFPYILVNPDGKVLSSTSQLKSLKYKLVRDEWTVAHEQSVYNSIYTRYKKVQITEQESDIKGDPKGTINVTLKNSGWYTLEVTATDKNGDSTMANYGFYVTGGKSYWYNNNDNEAITLTPDQNQYNPGDKAQILLQSSLPSGDYLITVEREGIYSEKIKHFDSPANVIEVPIEANYVPVVYVAVSSYSVRTEAPTHSYGEVDMDKPKGFFGVTALHINPYVRSFNVDIKCDKPSYKPGEQVKVKLTASMSGKPLPNAEITFMAVDRGVIDLIDYHVPNPINYFYSEHKYPLCVIGGDSRAYLMDPVTYSLKDLTGGDSEEDTKDERKDFRPTAVFEPYLVTGADGTVECTFNMPDSLTTYRMTAFGVKEDLFALKESEVKVQNPINVQQVQPQRLRARDTAECGVLITNLGAKTEAVTVSLEVRSPKGNTVQDEQEGRITVPGSAMVDGPSTHTVHVDSGYSSVVYFDVAALAEGTVELVYKIESELLNERLISPIRIDETYVYETVTMTSSTDSKQTEQVIIPGFSKNGKGSLKFTLDATRLGPLESAVDYVFRYPYGCLEQRSSAILPLLLFEDYIDVFGLDSHVSNTHTCISHELNFWAKNQMSGGGFPYWPGEQTYDSPYVSARIGHICAVAKKRGYTDKEIGINTKKLGGYLAGKAFSSSYTYQRAYIAYVLALLGDNHAKDIIGSVMQKINDCNNVALAYLGLACLEVDDRKGAEKAAGELRKYIQSAERSVTMLPRDGEYFDVWYTSNVSNLATALQLYVSLNPSDKLVDRLIDTLFKTKSARGYWNNTSDTAKVLDAVYAYIKKRNLDNLDYSAAVKVEGSKVMDGAFKGVTAKPVNKTINFSEPPFADLPVDKPLNVDFEKDGTGELYYTVEMHYALPDEINTARDEGIALEYAITDVESGNELDLKKTVIELVAGKTYRATIRIQTPRNRTYIAMRSPIPSGAQIIDSTFVTASFDAEGPGQKDRTWRQWLTKKEIYDNEVQFFWDRFDSGATEVTYTFRAGRRGVYPTPCVLAECMYEPEIFGRTDGYLFVIK